MAKAVAQSYNGKIPGGDAIEKAEQALVDQFNKYDDYVTNKLPGKIDKLLKNVNAPKGLRDFFKSEIPDAVVAFAVRVAAANIAAKIGPLVQNILSIPGATKATVKNLIADKVNEEIQDAFATLRPCYPLWEPTISFTLNPTSASIVNADRYTNPFLTVKPLTSNTIW